MLNNVQVQDEMCSIKQTDNGGVLLKCSKYKLQVKGKDIKQCIVEMREQITKKRQSKKENG